MRRCSVVTTGHLHQDHIAAIEGLHGDVTVDRRCSDLVELIAAARAGRADAALIIGGTEELTDSRLAELHDDGVVVVAISDLADERRRLAGLGIVALPDDVAVDLLIPALRGEEVEPPEELDAELEALVAAESPAPTPGEGRPEDRDEDSMRPEPDTAQGAASADDLSGGATASDEGRTPGGSDGRAPGAERADADPDADPVGEPGGAGVVESALVGRSEPGDLPDLEPGAVVEGADEVDRLERGDQGQGPESVEHAGDAEGAEGAGDADHADHADESPAEELESEQSGSPASGITVVWGAPGSPGRTTTAVNMAAELAGTGRRVLLVDADTVAASAAVQLGLIEESAGLAQACRQADLGRLDASRLRRMVTLVDVAGWRMHVLTGLPRADRWRELRERGLRQVLRIARDEYDHVVVDVSAAIEQDEDLTYDTFAPQRHAAAVAALEEADAVLAVGAADPVGFPRLVKALEERRLLVPEAPEPQVVINQLRAQAVGRSPEEQIAEAWAHWGAAATIVRHLPWDRESCDVALLRGQVLAEAAPGSELRRGIAALAGVELPERRRGLFRRPRGGERRSRRRAARRGRGGRRGAAASDSSAAASTAAGADGAGDAGASRARSAGEVRRADDGGSAAARSAAEGPTASSEAGAESR